MTLVHVVTEILNGLLTVLVYVQNWQDKKVEQRDAIASTPTSSDEPRGVTVGDKKTE